MKRRNANVAEPIPLLETVRDLVDDVLLLIRQEISLAKAELGEKADQVRTAMVAIIIGLLFGLASVVILAQAAAVALSSMMPDWLAAATAGILLGLAAVLSFKIGTSRLEPENLRLNRTMESVADDASRLRKGLPT